MIKITRLDIEEIVLFWEEIKTLYGYLSQRTPRKHDLFRSLEQCVILGLVDDGQLLGICSLYLNDGPWGPFGRIENVAIMEDYRGKGYGKLIVKNAIERAKSTGCYKTELVCNDENVGFYLKCDMNKMGNCMKVYYES